KELEVPQHVLRFWETRFSQVNPMKRGGGRRYYRPQDVDLLKGIRKLLYEEGFTIKGVRKILRQKGIHHVISVCRDGGESGPSDTEAPMSALLSSLHQVRELDRAASGQGPKGAASPYQGGAQASTAVAVETRVGPISEPEKVDLLNHSLDQLAELKVMLDRARESE
ncbi:MAG: MerR family transcriptional regulator, partial [Alphaproteobacteria bacterium]